MNLSRLSLSVLAALALAATLVACDDAATDEGAADGPKPDSTEALITAATGGAVTLDDGAGVNVPAGALAADTTLTIESTEPAGLPDAAGLRGLLYDFGPNGTTFLMPVALTLPKPGAPAAGETIVLSWLDETSNTWVDLPTTVSGDTVTAPVDHFTRFIVRFRPGALPGECEFTACGGDAVGTWTLDSACVDIDDNPFAEQCPTATFTIELTGATGSLEIGGDASYTVDFHFTGALSYTLPAACGVPANCADMSDAENGTTCAVAAGGDGCTCTQPITDDNQVPETGTYTTDGNTITTTSSEAGSTPSVAEYCVDGNVLKVRFSSGSGQSQIVTLTK